MRGYVVTSMPEEAFQDARFDVLFFQRRSAEEMAEKAGGRLTGVWDSWTESLRDPDTGDFIGTVRWWKWEMTKD